MSRDPERAVPIYFFRMGMVGSRVAPRFLGMYESWVGAVKRRTAAEFVLGGPDSVPATASLVVVSPSSAEDVDHIMQLAQRGVHRLALYVPPVNLWFDGEVIERLHRSTAFAFGSAWSRETEVKYREFGLDYVTLPLATDPSLMRAPVRRPRPLDIVFIGGLEHRDTAGEYIPRLLEVARGRRVAFLGTGWERFGLASRKIEYGRGVANLYRRSRIGVNFHDSNQKLGERIQLDLNNRTFDVPAAGCLLISDNVAAIEKAFPQGGVLAADDPDEWCRLISVALELSTRESRAMRTLGQRQVLADNTWGRRADALVQRAIEVLHR